MTGGQVLDTIHNTSFVITDQLVDNGGVGSAAWGHGTHSNRDQLYFEAFDGDNDLEPGGSHNDYADPAFTRGEAMVAVMLHEVGHMNRDGQDWNDSSHRSYRWENNNDDAGFNNSVYWSNNEAFANAFAQSVAAGMGFDISAVQLVGGFKPVDPLQLYHDRSGHRFSHETMDLV